jgi:hypothetical protein
MEYGSHFTPEGHEFASRRLLGLINAAIPTLPAPDTTASATVGKVLGTTN